MSSTANILPITSAEPVSEDGNATLAGCAGPAGEFQNLVAHALQFAQQDGGYDEGKQIPANSFPRQSQQPGNMEPPMAKSHPFAPQSKNVKPGAKFSEINSEKKHAGHSAVPANHVAHVETKVAVENSQSAPISALAAALAVCLPERIEPAVNPKIGSNEKSAQNVSAAQINGVVERSKAQQNLGTSSFFELKTSHVARVGHDIPLRPLPNGNAVEISRKALSATLEISDKSPVMAHNAIQPAKNVATAAENVQTPVALDKSSDSTENHQSKIGNPTSQNVSASDLKAPAVAPPLIHGTTVAQQNAQMKKPENANEVAGQNDQAEKVLPGKIASLPVERSLSARFSVPTRADKAGRAPAGNLPAAVSARASDAAAAVHSVSAGSSLDKTSSVSSTSLLPASNASARAVDRTQDLVALHATRLRDASMDSLRVVIKPDVGMELSLELRQRGDGVDVRAVLQQGDFNQLNQQWPELQHRLEQRGVKLEPLAGQNFTSDESHSFQQRKNQPQELLDDGAPAEFSLASSVNRSQSRQTVGAAAHNGWQTWA